MTTYKIQITTSLGVVTIYLDTLMKLEEELKKYEGVEKVEATKVLTK